MFSKCLAKEKVTCPFVQKILSDCLGNRSVGVTNMNERSSRSHTIFGMVIESRLRYFDESKRVSGVDAGAVKISRIVMML